MQYTEIMIRYGELSTKGRNRKDFIGRLNGNVTKALHEFNNLTIRPKHDRMHIELNGNDAYEVIKRLKNVFGIQNFSPMIKVAKNMDDVHAAAVELMRATADPNASFKVNTRRSDHSFALDTNQMNLDLGGYLLKQIPSLKVQMKNPDVTLYVEVRKEGIFLTTEKIPGAGGMPVGSAGKGMLMLSGGIDSPVAGYYALKRGIDIEMVHFFSPPYTSENSLAKAKELTAKLVPYVGSITFIAVPFAEIQEEIKSKLPESYLMTIQRRMMLRLVDRIRQMRGDLAIINGESVGQVASQTLESMVAINDVTATPIIRPVATMDKNEIIEVAKQIDTFDLSVLPYADSCTVFAPKSPKTKPSLEKSRYYEQQLDVEGLIQHSIDNIQITEIKANDHFLNSDIEEIASLL